MFTRHFHALLVMTLTSQTRQTSHWYTWVYFTLFYSTNLFDQSVHLVRWKVLVRVLKLLIRTFWITFDPWFGFNSPLYQMKKQTFSIYFFDISNLKLLWFWYYTYFIDTCSYCIWWLFFWETLQHFLENFLIGQTKFWFIFI